MPPPPHPVWVIAGPLASGDAAPLCEHLREVLASSRAAVVVCDVGGLKADIVTVDVLARLQLTARRLGCRIELHSGTPELARLLAFVGLADVLGLGPRRQPEEREQPRRVEERVDRGDAAL
jgi:ABC-type transporter Mla MlaB component